MDIISSQKNNFKSGSMRIYTVQQNYIVGDFSGNVKKIIGSIQEAKLQGADLVVFTELCVCGYPAADLLYFKEFINDSLKAVDEIRQHANDIGVIIGAPQRNDNPKGKDLFNAAYFLYNKEIKALVQKTCLPNYDIFEEYRYFEPAYQWDIIHFKGKKIALTICEDIWNLGDNPLYRTCPMDQLMLQQPDLMINISASPFDYTHAEDRKATIKQNVLKYKLPMIYVNATGAQTQTIFDGSSLVFDKDANLCHQLSQFDEDATLVQLKADGTFEGDVLEIASRVPESLLAPERLIPSLNIGQVRKAIVLGISDYFRKLGLKKAIIGNSGGIDSAVTIALACEALGNENVLSVLMPSQFSSSHSISDGEQLCKNLNSPYHIIPIEGVYKSFEETLHPVFKGTQKDITEENIQARSRGNILMALANKFGLVLLNTSNKSELSVGYGTMYGDMAGGLSVLGDCYKLQVYELAKNINSEKEIIPLNILEKAPSAELRPGQLDSQSLPAYDLLDPVLYQYIEWAKQSAEIREMGYDADVIKFALALVNKNEFKRYQFCPILRISPKAFGPGRKIPVVAKYFQ